MVALLFPVRYPATNRSAVPRIKTILFCIGLTPPLFGKNQNFVHHAEIFVQQNVTVKHEGTGNCGIAKIKTALDAVIGMPRPFPEGNLIGVTKVWRNGLSIHFEKHEMDLVNMKSMGLEGVVFYDPILDSAYMSSDGRLFVGFENLLLLSVDGDVELNGTVCPTELFGEIELP